MVLDVLTHWLATEGYVAIWSSSQPSTGLCLKLPLAPVGLTRGPSITPQAYARGYILTSLGD